MSSSSELIQAVLAILSIALFTYGTSGPKLPMRSTRTVDWSVVAEFEHDLGMEHVSESADACPTPELHRPQYLPSGHHVDTIFRALSTGAMGPNTARYLLKDGMGRVVRVIPEASRSGPSRPNEGDWDR